MVSLVRCASPVPLKAESAAHTAIAGTSARIGSDLDGEPI
jgi:hypothetical protein